MYIIDKTNRSERSTRGHDYHSLAREARTNPDPGARKEAVRAMERIKLEDKPIRSMRESLIKAHRRGDWNEVKDIHDIVAHKRKFRNE